MSSMNISDVEQQFLIELYKKTGGDLSVKTTMQEIGSLLGLDKTASSRIAEVLIGWDLVDVKSLSGAIGISNAGVEEARKLIGDGDPKHTSVKLGNSPVLDEAGRQAAEQMVRELKNQSGKLGLDFDALSEWMADLKTIDVQLTSPKPKTAVIRECFRSLKGILEKAGAIDALNQVKLLLSE